MKPLNDELYQGIIQAADVEIIPVAKFERIGELTDDQNILSGCKRLKQLNDGLGNISYFFNRRYRAIITPDVSPEEEVLVLISRGVTRDAFLAHESLHYFQDEASGEPGSEEQHMIREIQACMVTARFEGTQLVLNHSDFIDQQNKPEVGHAMKMVTALYGYFSGSEFPDIEVAKFVGRYGNSVADFREAFTGTMKKEEFWQYFESGVGFLKARSDKIEQMALIGESVLSE